MQELNQGGEEDEDKEEVTLNKAAKTVQASITSSSRLQRQEQEEVNGREMERRKEREEEAIRAERVRREKEKEERKREEMMTRRREEIQRPNTEVGVLQQTTDVLKLKFTQVRVSFKFFSPIISQVSSSSSLSKGSSTL